MYIKTLFTAYLKLKLKLKKFFSFNLGKGRVTCHDLKRTQGETTDPSISRGQEETPGVVVGCI